MIRASATINKRRATAAAHTPNHPAPAAATAPGPGGGFTLIEMVIALAIMSIVMVSITSAVVLASRAIPAADDASVTAPHTAGVLSRLADELRYAITVTEQAPGAVTFTVADRDAPGDPGYGEPEVIRYAWSTATHSLTRQYNGQSAIEVASKVEAFELTYETADVKETYPGPIVEKAGADLLASHIGNNDDEAVTSSDWYGQYLEPNSLTLDAGAVRWRPARIDIGARGDNYTHVVLGLLGIPILSEPKEKLDLQVLLRYTTSDKLPTGELIAQQSLSYDGDRLGYRWWPAWFTTSPTIPVDAATGIVVRKAGGGTGGYILYDNDNNPPGFLETDSGDSDWDYRDNEALTYRLWGYQSIQHPDQYLTRRYLTAITAQMQVGDDVLRQQTTAIRLLNTPEDLALRWVPDGPAPTTTTTSPRNDFTQPVTVQLSFRNNGPGAATFRINADWRGDGRCAPLYATIVKNPDPNLNEQVFVLGCDNTTGNGVLLVRTGLSNGMQDVRLLIDPTRSPGTINVRINDESESQTFQYTRQSVVHDDRNASAQADAYSDWQFVSVRVGGTP